MKIRHIGLVCTSDENADRFFCGVLGLKRTETRTLSRSLAQAVFDIDFESKMVYYQDENIQFEIFIIPHHPVPDRPIGHVSLEVDDLPEFLERCRLGGVTVRRVRKGEGFVTFILDADNNLFEIKEKQNKP